MRWYREDVDPQTRLYQLSTFMGHVDPASTAVYLTITPQLLVKANQRWQSPETVETSDSRILWVVVGGRAPGGRPLGLPALWSAQGPQRSPGSRAAGGRRAQRDAQHP